MAAVPGARCPVTDGIPRTLTAPPGVGSTAVPISQRRKLRLREIMQLAQRRPSPATKSGSEPEHELLSVKVHHFTGVQ